MRSPRSVLRRRITKVYFWLVLGFAVVVASGCQHRSGFGMGMPAIPPVGPPAIHAPTVAVRPPDLRLDLGLLEADEFFPPNARRVGPNRDLMAELAPRRRMRFPTAEPCTSPDERCVLYHDGMKRRDILHWLMLHKKGGSFPHAIFSTKLAFDVSWAEASTHFAVTHFVGRNSSEVFVIEADRLERSAIAVRAAMEPYFPPYLLNVPMFLQAYRWTRDGRLVVRGIARLPEEPYELFGCEVAVSFPAAGGEPDVTYLRGYIKPQEGHVTAAVP